MERYKMPVAVYLLLIKNKKILLSKRKNTGFYDEYYSLPSGHVEKEESIITAIKREAKEEIGIEIEEKNLNFIHILHRKSDKATYIDIFFMLKIWDGNPINNESDKCSEIAWYNIKKLPDNIIPYVKEIIIKTQSTNKFVSTIGLK